MQFYHKCKQEWLQITMLHFDGFLNMKLYLCDCYCVLYCLKMWLLDQYPTLLLAHPIPEEELKQLEILPLSPPFSSMFRPLSHRSGKVFPAPSVKRNMMISRKVVCTRQKS